MSGVLFSPMRLGLHPISVDLRRWSGCLIDLRSLEYRHDIHQGEGWRNAAGAG